jgi:serine/threonine protein kinase
MSCDQENCKQPLNKESKLNNCKCCPDRFCNEACLLSHLKWKHKSKLINNKMNNNEESPFIKEGVIVKEIYLDTYFNFNNFEYVMEGTENKKLGSGAFGEVYLIKNKKDGRLFAMKELEKEKIMNVGIKPDLIYREINCHLKLLHPNIVRLYSYHEDKKGFYLIMEYVEKGSLFQLVQKKGAIKERHAFNYFIQIASACYFLHKNNMIHRDIKPENCLIDREGNVKLCDFGWTIDSSNGTRETFCGTYEYMAPEVVQEQPYNNLIDSWSLGVLLYELIHSYSPFRVNFLFLILYYRLLVKMKMKWLKK